MDTVKERERKKEQSINKQRGSILAQFFIHSFKLLTHTNINAGSINMCVHNTNVLRRKKHLTQTEPSFFLATAKSVANQQVEVIDLVCFVLFCFILSLRVLRSIVRSWMCARLLRFFGWMRAWTSLSLEHSLCSLIRSYPICAKTIYSIVFEFRMGFQKDVMPSAVTIWRHCEHKYSRNCNE